MKANIKILTLILVLLTSCIIYPRQTLAQESNVSFQLFYDQLSPYGQWIEYSNYGYVWIPDAGPDFVPYSTNGHWILTDDGWAWDSDYNWGWAAFHYGRWSFSDSFGWFWVPDNVWGPAWVNWREAEGYYGWSPMEPGVSVAMSFGGTYNSHNDHWIFVNNRDIERTDINIYYVNRTDHDRIIRNSTVIQNTYIDNSRHSTYVTGPSRSQVQSVTGRTITPVIIRENNKPGKEISNGQLRIYRPQIVKNNTDGKKAIPSRITTINEIKKIPSRNSTNQNPIGNPGNRTISQPVRTVEPQNNNSRPAQQQNKIQQNNKPVPQNGISTPSNSNHIYQPGQTPLSNPSDVNRPIRKPDAVTPQNNNSQSIPQRTFTPQNNTSQPVPQRTVTPQNNTSQPIPQRTVTPQNNNVHPDQQRNVTPQNNTSQPVPQRTVTPQNNNVRPDQQRNVTPQNNNQGQKPTPPVNVQNKPQQVQPKPANQTNKIPVRQKKPLKQKVITEQPKVPDTSTDKK
jgi:hypothetical protein